MTANQIALRNTYIQQEIAENQLAETERHNQAVEDIQNEGNRLKQLEIDNYNTWKERDTQITKEYNDNYLKYLNRTEDNKQYWEAWHWDIEQRKVSNDKLFKDETIRIQDMMAQNESEKNRIQEEWNHLVGSQRWEEIGLSREDLALRSKAIEYENAWRHESNEIARNKYVAEMDRSWAQLNWEREQLNLQQSLNWKIANLQTGIREKELEFQFNKFYESELPLSKSQKFSNYITPFIGRNGLPGVVSSVGPVISGLAGPAPIRAFNALFK